MGLLKFALSVSVALVLRGVYHWFLNDGGVLTEAPDSRHHRSNQNDGQSRMQPKGPSLGLIARELALDISSSAFAPDDVAHIPGVANIAADVLSRRHLAEYVNRPLPSYLRPSMEIVPPTRDKSWWRTLPGSQKRT